jgi:hypothetical protein
LAKRFQCPQGEVIVRHKISVFQYFSISNLVMALFHGPFFDVPPDCPASDIARLTEKKSLY